MYLIIFKDKFQIFNLGQFYKIPEQFQDKWHFFQIPGVFMDQGQIQGLFKGILYSVMKTEPQIATYFYFFDNLLSACHLVALILLLVTHCMRWILLSLCYWKISNAWKTTNCSFQGITHNTDTISTRKSVHGTRMPPPIVFISPAIKH